MDDDGTPIPSRSPFSCKRMHGRYRGLAQKLLRMSSAYLLGLSLVIELAHKAQDAESEQNRSDDDQQGPVERKLRCFGRELVLELGVNQLRRRYNPLATAAAQEFCSTQ